MSETAVRCGDRLRDYDELFARAARVATGLGELGIEPGQRIAVVLRNEPAFLEVSAAARLLGAAPVPVNWHWKGHELRHLLSNSEARAVFVHADLLRGVEEAVPDGIEVIEVPIPEEVAAAYGLDPAALQPSGRHRELESWIAGLEPWSQPPRSAPMSMIYTSGTTGLPKGIIREPTTPEQDQAIGQLLFKGLGLSPEMRTLVPAPLYHTAPNAHAMMAASLRTDLTIMPRFDAEEMLRIVERERIEHIQMVPTMFTRLLRLPDEVRERYDVSSLRSVVHAAAPCPVHVKQAMIDWWGPIISEYYGGSESGIAVHSDSEQWLAHPGTVGAPFGGADIRILDEEGGELGPGETGEVFIRTPDAWPDFTYVGDPDKRAAMERDGYITQGDVGHVDEDGFLFLSDRVSDMVISGGVNIYPAEIEQCLSELDAVRDVAVVGIPDEDFGEALAAHLEVDHEAGLTEDDVRSHVRTRLAGYKVPKVVVFDDELPREDSGKLFKRRIRERYREAS